MKANGHQLEASAHEPAKVLAVVQSYHDLHAVLRRRKDELDLSCQVIDRAGGLTGGHGSKLLAPQPLKRANWDTLAFLLPALGLRLAVLEDPDALAQLKKFPTRQVKTPSRSVPWCRKGKQMLVSMRFVRRIARQGGEARAQKLTPEQRSASARKAAKARWHKPRVVEITNDRPARRPSPPNHGPRPGSALGKHLGDR
jgi:hypothetical protein